MKQNIIRAVLLPLQNQKGEFTIFYGSLIVVSMVLGGGIYFLTTQPTRQEQLEERYAELFDEENSFPQRNMAQMSRETNRLANTNEPSDSKPCKVTIGPDNASPGEQVSIGFDIAGPLENIDGDVSCVAGNQTFSLYKFGGIVEYTIPSNETNEDYLVSCTKTSDGGGTTVCSATAWGTVELCTPPSQVIHGQLYRIYHTLYGSDGGLHCLTDAERDKLNYDNGWPDIGWTSDPQGPCIICSN